MHQGTSPADELGSEFRKRLGARQRALVYGRRVYLDPQYVFLVRLCGDVQDAEFSEEGSKMATDGGHQSGSSEAVELSPCPPPPDQEERAQRAEAV
jgi:hypothetical protein